MHCFRAVQSIIKSYVVFLNVWVAAWFINWNINFWHFKGSVTEWYFWSSPNGILNQTRNVCWPVPKALFIHRTSRYPYGTLGIYLFVRPHAQIQHLHSWTNSFTLTLFVTHTVFRLLIHKCIFKKSSHRPGLPNSLESKLSQTCHWLFGILI